MEKLELWLRLSAVKGLGGKRTLHIAQRLKQQHIDDEACARCGLDSEQRHQFWALPPQRLQETWQWLEVDNHSIITADDAAYPEQLRQVAAFPALLYIKGDVGLLPSLQVAVVGSRNCSHYGRQWAEYFTQALALSGLTITSGLARGIDGIAHRATLSVCGSTIAVLGSGLKSIYPQQHLRLVDEIIDAGGAVLSEFPLETPPCAVNFPRRNRIISGLSRGVLVIEASMKSGSLVTARYALEQNRDVYALPGPLGNNSSEGTHWLIQQGALLVAHPNNIIEQLNNGLGWLPFSVDEAIYSSDKVEVPLPFADVLANVGDEVTPVDVVAERAGQPVPAIVAKLLELELAGWIAAVPGGYVRLRRACHVRRTNVLV